MFNWDLAKLGQLKRELFLFSLRRELNADSTDVVDVKDALCGERDASTALSFASCKPNHTFDIQGAIDVLGDWAVQVINKVSAELGQSSISYDTGRVRFI